MDFFRDAAEPFFTALNYNFFELGEAKITPLSIIYLLLLSVLLVYISGKLRNFVIDRVLGRTSLDISARQSIGTIFRYLVLFLGLLVILQTVGINLTTLNVVAGAIGIGVGFGLQNIASNFISGLIIMIERPVKVGDRIEVGGINGQVSMIGARSTKVRTNDDITIIVPNSKFVSENVINWSFGEKKVRFNIPVDVAYDSDVESVTQVLLAVANANTDVLALPEPVVRLTKFDGGTLNLELRVWSETMLHRKGKFFSDLNFAIVQAFRDNDISVPSSDVDLLLKTNGSDRKASHRTMFANLERRESDSDEIAN
jgi:small-conductance mechanosensitive channel